ncbi:gamma-glutamylcyclotransferase [Castellaniella sp.]|uniref:gamma-glutamylcyclotransferase n=1 Tax=Castellaniella sp. TaxID=1955812 RepID=UPI002AFE3D80|nr:gamma-glutamylcyclotransferase [Castellaniella sp.]
MNALAPRSAHQPPPPEAFRLRDAEWQAASIRQALQHWDGRSDLWIFGYGSLIWRPEFDFLESRQARIHGYHRALCLWSRINRGTPAQPGLVFGLDLGGACTGRAFRIAADRVPDTMHALWLREMPSGAYIPRWLRCHTFDGPVPGLVFTMDRQDDGYAHGLSTGQIVAAVRQGHGRYGACTDYVLETARALNEAGIPDRRLQAVVRALQQSPESLLS